LLSSLDKSMVKIKNYKDLLGKIEEVTKQKGLDLSAGEDLSIAIMNLISIEEHLFFTSQKTGREKYLDLLNEVRAMRASLLKEIIKDYEGEVWCVSKHLLAASMRVMEVGTKELKKGDKKKAANLFQKAYQLYSLFWAINLKVVEIPDIKQQKEDRSVFVKIGEMVQKAIDCCKE